MKTYKKFPGDLLLVLTWVVLTLVFVFTPVLEDTLIRTALGIPMVLFVPGYALVAALFPKKDDPEPVERIALSFGLSIAVVPLLGLLLNFTFGIKLIPILITLCVYAMALTFIAAYRRGKLPEDERFSIPFHRIYEAISSEINTPKGRIGTILTVLLIFSVILAASMVYLVIATPKVGERFTEFYILDVNGTAENYPTDLKSNSSAGILVGVVNHEYAPVNYTVQVALDREVLADRWFILGHNETWEKEVAFVPGKVGNNMKLEFWLFKEDNFTAPYRALHLWVNVTK